MPNSSHSLRTMRTTLALAIFAALHTSAYASPTSEPTRKVVSQQELAKIEHVIVIYGENRSFNNLYGMFPGANGVAQAIAQGKFKQTELDGKELPHLPPVWKEHSKTPQADPAYPAALANAPFRIDEAPIKRGLEVATRDLVHRFYQHQMQINGGKNDRFAAISDAGGLTMGYYDGSKLPLWKLAQQYTLADNFFMSAFGGSFLNHMWLACACTPVFPNAPEKMKAQLNPDGSLKLRDNSASSALAGAPRFLDGPLTPDNYAVNTMQAPYQPSGILPPLSKGADARLADPAENPLPPQTQANIGDMLSKRQVSWKWYAGGWNRALQDRSQIYDGEVKFQVHHQPFNYFKNFEPGSVQRAVHLKDGEDLLADIAKGDLPQVSFYKPQGSLNEHPGYTDVLAGDQHIAELVAKLQASPQWGKMAIIITYDENGGFWDHVSPPKGERWGPGSRIPAIIISPYAKRGFVDHTQYDTTSILQFISRRFQLDMLPGIRKNMGDMTNAFDFKQKPMK